MTSTGLPFEQLVRVRALHRGGARKTFGSATVIARRLVLTAAHVVFDRGTGLPHESVEVVSGKTTYSARVVWPQRYVRREGVVDGADIALLDIVDPSWTDPGLATGWGRLTGRRGMVECEALGYPRVAVDAEQERPALHIFGHINPGTGHVGSNGLRDRVDVNVDSAVPTGRGAGPAAEHTPWGGVSGSAVFAAGFIVAVVVIDTPGFDHGALSAVPVTHFVSDPAFTELLVSRGGFNQIQSVELSTVIAAPVRVEAELEEYVTRGSRTILLRPEFEIVDFHGRDEIIDDLEYWCARAEPSVDVRLVVGPGGRGKTRLVQELIKRMDGRPSETFGEQNWVAGFLRTSNALDLSPLRSSAAPILVAIDYAEGRADIVGELIRELERHSLVRARVVLIARSAGGRGGWLDQIRREAPSHVGPLLTLGPLDEPGDARRVAYESAYRTFVSKLADLEPERSVAAARPIHEIPLPAEINEPRFGDPLTLQLAALLVALDTDGSNASLSDETSDPLEVQLLDDHERGYWSRTLPSGVDLTDLTQREIVLTASLVPALDEDGAVNVLRTLPALMDTETMRLRRIAEWVRGIYPPPAGRYWGTLQPDRLLEHLTIEAMHGSAAFISALVENFDVYIEEHVARTLANASVRRIELEQLARLIIVQRTLNGESQSNDNDAGLRHDLDATVGELIGTGGPGFAQRIANRSNADLSTILETYTVLRQVARLDDVAEAIERLSEVLSARVVRNLKQHYFDRTDFAIIWLLDYVNVALSGDKSVLLSVADTVALLPNGLRNDARMRCDARIDQFTDFGVPRQLARIAITIEFVPIAFTAATIVSSTRGEQYTDVFAIAAFVIDAFRYDELISRVWTGVPVTTLERSVGRDALLRSLYRSLGGIIALVCRTTAVGPNLDDRMAEFVASKSELVARARRFIDSALGDQNGSGRPEDIVESLVVVAAVLERTAAVHRD